MRIGLVDAGARSGALPDVLTESLAALGSVVRFTVPAAGQQRARKALVQQLAADDCDRYVFCDTEDLAEQMLEFDSAPSFLVPGAAAMARRPAFWQQFVRHRALCFSRPLHERLQQLSCATSYFQYFPEPAPEPQASDATAGIFVEESSSDDSALAIVIDLAGQLGLRHLRVESRHRQSSTENVEQIELRIRPMPAADDDAALFHFVGDRPADGGGIAKAMAMGRIVIAPHASLAADYCADAVSGMLHAPARQRLALPHYGSERLAAMSRAARRKALNGRRDWVQDIERLQSLVSGDGRRWGTSDCSAHFDRAIRKAAHLRAWHD